MKPEAFLATDPKPGDIYETAYGQVCLRPDWQRPPSAGRKVGIIWMDCNVASDIFVNVMFEKVRDPLRHFPSEPIREGRASLPEAHVDYCSTEQAEASRKVAYARGGIIWWKVGEGKTRISLATIAMLQLARQWDQPKVYVVCGRAGFYDWQQEIANCEPSWHVYLDKFPHILRPGLPFSVHVCLFSYGSLRKLEETLDSEARFVVFDEGWRYKNPKSDRTQRAHRISTRVRSMLLSGSMMATRNLIELWSQAYAINRHHILAKSVAEFYRKFCIRDTLSHFPSQIPRRFARRDILKTIDPYVSINFPISNVEEKEILCRIPPSNYQTAAFKELAEDYGLEDHDIECQNALSVAIKIQQISSGYVSCPDGTIKDIPSTKRDRCLQLVEELHEAGEQVVIWCAFRHDVMALTKLLPFLSVPLVGGSEFNLKRWEDPSCNVAIATVAMGSAVNHFRHVQYGIFFSQNFKWLDLQQAKGRHTRKDSTHSTATFYHLFTQHSLDEHIHTTTQQSRLEEKRVITQADLIKWKTSLA